jgi:hypothetical protein
VTYLPEWEEKRREEKKEQSSRYECQQAALTRASSVKQRRWLHPSDELGAYSISKQLYQSQKSA